ncbi:DUF3618 domain-containing protein [Krasilnikovia sp. MM14-A1004]|uniref:DUF3618 domain-containing protein n=1 Tax=Krasilnikovia sp. MM14-A1004 TaxID=3373541 RepID=UPI00399CE8F6
MTTSYTSSGATTSHTPPGVPDHIRADLEQRRVDLGDTVTALTGKVAPRTRVSGALSAMKRRTVSGLSHFRAQAPHRARQVQQAVHIRPVPAAVCVIALAGAVTAALLGRRAVNARSARSRRLTRLLHR